MTAEDENQSTRAAAWVQHLRDGGTTPWRRWLREPQDVPPSTGPVPGAAQLELLRRLNVLGPLPERVDHVLSRPGPGRGPLNLGLPDRPGVPVAPRHEVLRVAAGVLADLTAQLPPARPARRRRSRRDPELPSFVVDGLPLTAAETRARLAATGLPDHRPRFSWLGARPDPGPDLVVVLAGPLDRALREAWGARVQRGAGRAWPRFVSHWAGRGDLPASAALGRIVAHWGDRLGAENVYLVPLDDSTDPVPLVAELLGAARSSAEVPDAQVPVGEPVRLAPAMVDALRRVNVVLEFVCPEPDRAARRTALVELMREEPGRPEPADVPPARRPWVASAAEGLVERLRKSGCRVHGDLGALRLVAPPTGRRVGDAEVLDAMVRMIHRVDAELAGGRRDGRGRR